eukprot:m.28132 g.28132  ORF g.28132 m.28132 type:complete len:78 (-) comp4501_c1_seq1:133-366(-)
MADSKFPSVPSKDERAACWDARDDYHNCLVLRKESEESCKAARAAFEKACPASWVKHFDKKRAYDRMKQKIYADDKK